MRAYLLCGQSDVRIQTIVEEIAKNFFFCSAEDGGRLRGRRFETGSKSRRRWQCFCSFLYYQTTTTTIITFSCVFFTLGRRKWLHSSHQELRLRRRPPFSTFYSSAVFCSLLLEEDGLEPPLSTRKTFVPHDFHRYQFCGLFGKKVDFRHEVLM